MTNGKRLPVALLISWLIITLAWWGFAFLPVSADNAEWLTAAKNACFGTLANGLPDTFGWILLIAGPISLLLAILIVWWRDIAEELKSISRRPAGVVLFGALITAFAWEGAWVSGRIRSGLELASMKFESDTNQPLPPDYPRTSRPAADFRLVDQSGASVSPKSFRGKTVFLTFAFAHCATVCPVLVTQSLQALNQLDPERTSLVIVTLDPWRDTPRSLPFLAEKWKLPKNAHVLSGDVVDVNAVISEYGIPTSRDEKNGDVSHPAIVYVLDGRGRIAYTFNNPSPGWLLEAERRVRDGYARR